MNRGIYTTAQGMLAAQQQLDVVANNLANVNTTGYKQDVLSFAQQFQQKLQADGGQGALIGELAEGPDKMVAYTVFQMGVAQHTGGKLDVALGTAEGAFAIQTAQGTRYTRDGSFQLNESGTLVTHDGNPVLDERGNTIEVPAGSKDVRFNELGELQADGNVVGKLGVYQATFKKAGSNQFTANDARPLENTHVAVGALESSNVNPIESMIQMIDIQRRYELAQKSVTQQDESTQRLIQSLSERG